MQKNIQGDANDSDLQIVTLLVAKHLRQEHQIDVAPTPADYMIAPTERFHAGCAELHVSVNLGRGVTIRIDYVWWRDVDRDVETLVTSAQEISDKVAEVRGQAPEIKSALAEVKAATKREIANANRRGLPYEMISVSVTPIEAASNDDWFIRVEYSALGQSLKLETSEFEAIDAEDVAEAFAGIRDDQTSRAASRAALDEIGATGTIDAVVVAAIADADLDVADVLRNLGDSDDGVVHLASQGGSRFVLHWDEGAVFGQVDLGDGVTWHQNRLDLKKAAKTMDPSAQGSPLSEFFEHPFLDERLVVRSGKSIKGEQATIYCNHALLAFDADSGRVWPA